MTVDELIRKLNDGWGSASLDISICGDRKWTATLQYVVVRGSKAKELEQPCMKADTAPEALSELVLFLRGKRICLRGANGGADGEIFKVPKTLAIPRLR